MKKQVREILQRRDLDALAELAGRRRRVLGTLVSLTFDRDPLVGWRAVEGLGVAAARIADEDPECVREHLRRLHWLLSDESGGICWRAPEALAEIVSQRPGLFADHVPIVVSLMLNLEEEDLGHFRAGALWAIGRLGTAAGKHLPAVLPAITSALEHADPQVRGMAVWCLERVGQTGLLTGRPELLSDDGPVDFYEGGLLSQTSVRHLTQRALADAPSEPEAPARATPSEPEAPARARQSWPSEP